MTNADRDFPSAASGATAPGTFSEAATTDDQIKAALAKLDPKNDDHWTKSGDVAMDAINAMLPAPITRQRFNEVAPGFERATATGAPAVPAGGVGDWVAPPDGGTAISDVTHSQGVGGGGGGGTVSRIDVLGGGGGGSPATATDDDEITALKKQVKKLTDDIAFLRALFGWPTKGA